MVQSNLEPEMYNCIIKAKQLLICQNKSSIKGFRLLLVHFHARNYFTFQLTETLRVRVQHYQKKGHLRTKNSVFLFRNPPQLTAVKNTTSTSWWWAVILTTLKSYLRKQKYNKEGRQCGILLCACMRMSAAPVEKHELSGYVLFH